MTPTGPAPSKEPHLRTLIGALTFLLTRSLFNALKSRLLRLKKPKYLVGAIVSLAWFYFWFGGARERILVPDRTGQQIDAGVVGDLDEHLERWQIAADLGQGRGEP
jgi:hypothetical protein